MIKTNAQRDRTLVRIAGFKNALKGVDRGATKRSIAIRGSYLQIVRQLEALGVKTAIRLTPATPED